ncbi:MAG: BspA family leucine-rich repeat surface protein, partial [Bacteroidales bacterium]|nr:BspA family leucine-rich repeat surface protein [Bacteroidales bacterium]
MKRVHKLDHIGKRSLSALLALVLSFSLLESGVFAALSYDPAEEDPEEAAAENAEEIPEETAGQEDAAPEEEEDAEPAEEEETEPEEENFSNEIVALEGVDPAGEEETDLFDDSTVADADPAGGEEPDEYGTSTYAAGDTGAFAVYCETDTSLTFYYGTVPAEGDTYNGKTVTNVYTGFDTAEAYTSASDVPWHSIRSNVTTVTFDETFQNVQPKAMAYWFYNFENCTEISGLNYIDTSKVTSMCELFDQCYLVENLDVSEWNTSNVTNMSFMFRHCDALTNIDVSGFVTSNVTTMQQMFGYTSGLTELDLSNFDTSNVTAMNGMFRSSGIKVLDLSGFDTSNVTEMNAMFRTQYSNEVAAIETIYVDKDWTINREAEDFNDTNMFYNCWNLVGGNGTTFNSEKIDSTMAHIDGGTSNPGYFTSNRAVTTDISGTIEWDDNNNQDGIRPQSVTVSLLDGNGQQVTDENGDPVSVTVSSDDNWTFSFSGVFKYDDEGKQIKYTISEDPVNNYKTDYDGYNIKNTLAYTFAVYSVDDGSFTFYYGTVPAEGDTYNGKIVTNVYTGFDTAEAYTSAS